MGIHVYQHFADTKRESNCRKKSFPLRMIYQLKRVADCYLHKYILRWILLFNALFFLAFPSKHSLFSDSALGLLRVSKELIYLF